MSTKTKAKRPRARTVKLPVELYLVEIHELKARKRRLVCDEAGHPTVMTRQHARMYERTFNGACSGRAECRKIRILSLTCAAPARGKAGAV